MTVPGALRDPAGGATAPALSVEHIGQSYGVVAAVDDVSIELATGDVVALVGHSGSGKSTLLRLIAGLERPATGTVAIGGRVVCGGGRFVPPEKRGVGMMFQDYALFPHLSVIDNVMFGLNRLRRAEARARARAGLDAVGLAGRAKAYPHALSGGEQQRVALVRALAPRPAVLLMDEPFSNLDRRTRDLIRDDTAAFLRNAGTTAILVTHDPEDAIRMGGRILVMQAGRILQGGTADELHRRPRSLAVARFFSAFNEIAGVCRGGALVTPLGAFPAPGLAEGAAAIACVRPRDIAFAAAGASARTGGTVVSRAFSGDDEVLTVAVPGLSRPLRVRAPPDMVAAAGDSVSLAVSAASVPVFAADG